VKVAFDRKTEFPSERGDFRGADGTQLRAAHAEIAQAEGDILILRVDLGQQPGETRIGREELHHRVKIYRVAVLDDALGILASVFEQARFDLRHAADAVLLDDFGQVVLVTRKHNPGAGLKALPGGFMDPVQGRGGATVAENALTAALREATEETGISKRLLERAQVIPVGHRSYNRPFDIRVAWGDMPGTVIKKGDFFAVSTQAFCVKIPQDLSRVSLKAGDDAKTVAVVKISSLTPDEFGVADHLAMIRAAVLAAREGTEESR
jgi:ADP-ribose pyrophosphatase YjhB (NUDIX family)